MPVLSLSAFPISVTTRHSLLDKKSTPGHYLRQQPALSPDDPAGRPKGRPRSSSRSPTRTVGRSLYSQLYGVGAWLGRHPTPRRRCTAPAGPCLRCRAIAMAASTRQPGLKPKKLNLGCILKWFLKKQYLSNIFLSVSSLLLREYYSFKFHPTQRRKITHSTRRT